MGTSGAPRLLEARGIRVRFGGVRALDDVDLVVADSQRWPTA